MPSQHLVVLEGRHVNWWGMQEKMEEQLQPLFALLEDIQGRLARGGKIPSFGSLKDWALVRPPCYQTNLWMH